MNLLIPIREGQPLTRQVFVGLRDAIITGGLRAGERLPSSRDLAEQLGISRTVVLNAYDHLMAEGFVTGRRGSGTFVAPGFAPRNAERIERRISLSEYGRRIGELADTIEFPPRTRPYFRYDFAYGRGDISTFPFEGWRRLLLKHARATSVRGLDYAAPAGDSGLRDAIAAHVRRARGVVCAAEQVIVVNGSQQALDLIVRVLINAGDTVAIEDPHYQGIRATLLGGGARLRPITVDDSGLDPAMLPTTARAAFVTPSHQFPTGAVLSLDRRLALLDWAARADAFVVEDDYNGEFRYDGQPLESLQGLDANGRVIYIGTFSRTMFAALRVGYLIVPPTLVPFFTTAKWLADRHTASLEQRTLADFIGSGSYELYLRRLRRNLNARRVALLEAIDAAWKGRMRFTGATSGAHIVLWPGDGFVESDAIAAAARDDIGIYGVSPYFLGQSKPGVLLGYSQLSISEIQQGIGALSRILHPVV